GLRRLFTAVALGLVFFSGGAAPAAAGTDTYCYQKVGVNFVCAGPTHTLTGSRGTNTESGLGCGGEVYGMYSCGAPTGCMAYNGAAIRTPAIRHRSSVPRMMQGYSTWGSTPQPYNCLPGTPYRLAGPVTTADPAGVPVLEDRAAEAAPADVAALWPNADPSVARHFDTPLGDGWVMTVPADRKVCVAIEVPDTGWAYSCQGYNTARLQGTVMTIEDSNLSTPKGDLAVALPAEGSDGLQITRRDGSVKTVADVDGVSAIVLGANDTTVALDPAEEADGVKAQRFSIR
ncbi:MAG: hypothetical protein Q7T55_06270, partial [Solirubrobacteraceae bacterium]|nr:hypothetical protein [Solirubrobacteraceae bacterium]